MRRLLSRELVKPCLSDFALLDQLLPVFSEIASRLQEKKDFSVRFFNAVLRVRKDTNSLIVVDAYSQENLIRRKFRGKLGSCAKRASSRLCTFT